MATKNGKGEVPSVDVAPTSIREAVEQVPIEKILATHRTMDSLDAERRKETAKSASLLERQRQALKNDGLTFRLGPWRDVEDAVAHAHAVKREKIAQAKAWLPNTLRAVRDSVKGFVTGMPGRLKNIGQKLGNAARKRLGKE